MLLQRNPLQVPELLTGCLVALLESEHGDKGGRGEGKMSLNRLCRYRLVSSSFCSAIEQGVLGAHRKTLCLRSYDDQHPDWKHTWAPNSLAVSSANRTRWDEQLHLERMNRKGRRTHRRKDGYPHHHHHLKWPPLIVHFRHSFEGPPFDPELAYLIGRLCGPGVEWVLDESTMPPEEGLLPLFRALPKLSHLSLTGWFPVSGRHVFQGELGHHLATVARLARLDLGLGFDMFTGPELARPDNHCRAMFAHNLSELRVEPYTKREPAQFLELDPARRADMEALLDHPNHQMRHHPVDLEGFDKRLPPLGPGIRRLFLVAGQPQGRGRIRPPELLQWLDRIPGGGCHLTHLELPFLQLGGGDELEPGDDVFWRIVDVSWLVGQLAARFGHSLRTLALGDSDGHRIRVDHRLIAGALGASGMPRLRRLEIKSPCFPQWLEHDDEADDKSGKNSCTATCSSIRTLVLNGFSIERDEEENYRHQQQPNLRPDQDEPFGDAEAGFWHFLQLYLPCLRRLVFAYRSGCTNEGDGKRVLAAAAASSCLLDRSHDDEVPPPTSSQKMLRVVQLTEWKEERQDHWVRYPVYS